MATWVVVVKVYKRAIGNIWEGELTGLSDELAMGGEGLPT